MPALTDALPMWLKYFEQLDINLPVASSVFLTLAGRTSPMYVETLAYLATTTDGHEVPIDMAPAKCTQLDSYFYGEYARRNGQRPKTLQMEASWIATTEALHYASPALDLEVSWAWSDLALTVPGAGGRQVKVEVTTSQGRWKMKTSKLAVQNLLAVQRWHEDGGRLSPLSEADLNAYEVESLQSELDSAYLENVLLLPEVQRFNEIREELAALGVEDSREMPFQMSREERVEILEAALASCSNQPRRAEALQSLIEQLKA